MATAIDADDVIAATATAPGPGLRGIVRVSGPGAWRVALSGFEPVPDASPTRPVILAGSYRLDGLRPPLPVEVALWPAPRTYTGQELAEIHAPGSPPLLGLLHGHCLSRGARPARPGEFTLRAFLSGRIDLTRAEAVLGVIDARDPVRLEAALRQLAGGLAGPIEALHDRILDLLAHLEAGLDFVDEADVDPIARSSLARELIDHADALANLTDRLGRRDRSDDAPRAVLVGPPNAGKSRLFNALVGDDRAIVSPQAGTTRDYLSAACECDGVAIELIDTAGEEDAADPVSAEAQLRRASESERADVIIACEAVDAPAVAAFAADDARVVCVWTKADRARPLQAKSAPWILTSAESGEGIDALRRAVAEAVRRRAGDHAAIGTSARCRDAILAASASLRRASDAMALGAGDELIAFDLRDALDALGEVTGAVVADDVLDRIFSRFCIGK